MENNVKVYKPNSDDKQNKQGLVLDEEVLNKQKKIDEVVVSMPKEYGGRPKEKGKEPTRYGDWELKGRCIDF